MTETNSEVIRPEVIRLGMGVRSMIPVEAV